MSLASFMRFTLGIEFNARLDGLDSASRCPAGGCSDLIDAAVS